MIPPLEDGVLPEGVYDCTFAEIDQRFGRFQRSDKRIKLTTKLKAYLEELRKSGLADTVIVDGSYVTAKEEPSDIDLLVALRSGLVWATLRPFEYNAVSKRMVKQAYRFDAFAHLEDSPEYRQVLHFFQDVRSDAAYTAKPRKGVLRVRL
jgi:predicted nucleotidyltransferase